MEGTVPIHAETGIVVMQELGIRGLNCLAVFENRRIAEERELDRA